MIRRASLPRRLIRWPGLFHHHYALLRRYNGRLISAWSAGRLALRLTENTWL